MKKEEEEEEEGENVPRHIHIAPTVPKSYSPYQLSRFPSHPSLLLPPRRLRRCGDRDRIVVWSWFTWRTKTSASSHPWLCVTRIRAYSRNRTQIQDTDYRPRVFKGQPRGGFFTRECLGGGGIMIATLYREKATPPSPKEANLQETMPSWPPWSFSCSISARARPSYPWSPASSIMSHRRPPSGAGGKGDEEDEMCSTRGPERKIGGAPAGAKRGGEYNVLSRPDRGACGGRRLCMDKDVSGFDGSTVRYNSLPSRAKSPKVERGLSFPSSSSGETNAKPKRAKKKKPLREAVQGREKEEVAE